MTFIQWRKKQQITIDVVVVADGVVNQNGFVNEVESLLYQDCMSFPHTFTRYGRNREYKKQQHISINKGSELSKYYCKATATITYLDSTFYSLSNLSHVERIWLFLDASYVAMD